MAVLKSLLQQLAMPSCRWGHKWGCWRKLKDGTTEVTVFKFCIIQQRECLICNFAQLSTQTVDVYDGK